MIDAKQLFLKTIPGGDKFRETTRADWFQNALAYTLAQTVTHYRMSEEQLKGVERFINELLLLGEPEAPREAPTLKSLIYDVEAQVQELYRKKPEEKK